MKLKRNFTGEKNQRQKFNTALLRDPAIAEEFKNTLKNKYQTLQELDVEGEGINIDGM